MGISPDLIFWFLGPGKGPEYGRNPKICHFLAFSCIFAQSLWGLGWLDLSCLQFMAFLGAYLQMHFEFYQILIFRPRRQCQSSSRNPKFVIFLHFCPELGGQEIVRFELSWVYGFFVGISPDAFWILPKFWFLGPGDRVKVRPGIQHLSFPCIFAQSSGDKRWSHLSCLGFMASLYAYLQTYIEFYQNFWFLGPGDRVKVRPGTQNLSFSCIFAQSSGDKRLLDLSCLGFLASL